MRQQRAEVDVVAAALQLLGVQAPVLDQLLAEAVAFAEASPPPAPEELFTDVYKD